MSATYRASRVLLSVALLATGSTAVAGHRNRALAYPAAYETSPAIAYARVVDVRPMIEQVETRIPVRECYETTAYVPPAYGAPRVNTVGSTIAGGVIGGVIGDQFGRGEGRDAMRLFGALVGATLGHEAAVQRQAAYYPPPASATYPVTECTTHFESRIEDRTRGYRVTYAYEGRNYVTETRRPPGDRIPVEVSVRPAL